MSVKKKLIEKYALKSLELDFLGFPFENLKFLSYHHLLIPLRDNGLKTVYNGAILHKDTSHPLIHAIEKYDLELFFIITSHIFDMKEKKMLLKEDLLFCHELLDFFIAEHENSFTKKGNKIITDVTLIDKEIGYARIKKL